jgi:AraC-like DNA-binding protein
MTQGQFRIFHSGVPDIQAVASATRHVFPRHTHEQFGIGVIHRGAHKSLSGRGIVEAGPGDTITVNPGEVHDGAPIGDAGRSWRMLYVGPEMIAAAIADISDGRTRHYEFSRPVIPDARISNRFQRLFRAVTTSTASNSMILREEAFLGLLAAASDEAHRVPSGPGIPAGVRAAKALIDDDPAAPITLTDLAETSGLSRFQVLRGFVKATGFTPHAYLVQRRIDLARRLIARGTPLAEAAATGGFADQSHMTRIFIRKYGFSPGAYANAVS